MMLAHYAVLVASRALGDRANSRRRGKRAAPKEALAQRRRLHRETGGRRCIVSLGYTVAVRRPPAP
jgi:hypothetical protein